MKGKLRRILIGAAVILIGGGAARADDNTPAGPTFAKDVAPILNAHCVECHRPGEVAPMALTSYEEVRPWAKSIKTEVSERRMPPWHADPVAGPYLEENSLNEDQIKTIASWVEGGAMMGDTKDLPPAPKFSNEWKLGKPDLVLSMPEAFEVGPEGDDIYHCFVMPEIQEDTWLKGVEFRPGNRAVTHHVVLFLDGQGKDAVARDEEYPGPGYPCYGAPEFIPTDMVGVWAPGMAPEMMPEGVARPLPKGSRIAMQLHYHRNGKTEKDKSEVGIYFAKEPVRKRVYLGIALDPMLMIPAGTADYTSRASWRVPKDATILAVFPHMHVLGKSIAMTANRPDGTAQPLVSVSRYDFNWQRNYYFKQPVGLPAGAKIEVKAVYDNSDKNPRNPNKPPAPVHFGMGTNDEMNVGFVYFTLDGEDRIAQPAEFPHGNAIVSDYQ
ncbi:ascorbate-dependent monooxygenase [Candidatus Sumerlaeota bacterium]|nr:ascorbate-dependent monooxygenase [Candidatus Sumerlaeota bacterium]